MKKTLKNTFLKPSSFLKGEAKENATISKVIKKHKIKLSLLLIAFLLWLFCLPSVLFNVPTSTIVESREGFMLGARIADDGQWRFPKIDTVPNRFEQSILLFEDEYFYQHPGFNPIAISKALWQNITTDKRRGGSTLTQQVIRLSRKNKGRNYIEKIIEIFQATRLEVRHSKKEILNLYASNAPFGGNVVGLETASWRYFGIPSSELSWGQSAVLAVLPNAPSLIYPGKNEIILKNKRDRLLLKLFQKGVIDKTTYELAILENLPGKPLPLPDYTSHLTEKIRRDHQEKKVKTTINFHLQKTANRIAANHYSALSQNQINNLSILLLDVETREVLAYVGNASTTKENNNYLDIIDKSRSTGSVLKPFLYASMLDVGELLPNTLVADIPTAINGYSPQNFNKKYNGAVPASVALSRSLNIPAVRMLREFGLQRFYNKLKKLKLNSINKSPDYYGLALILGGAESSLWEITNTYAGMASSLNFFNASSSEYRSNEFKEPNYVFGVQPNFGSITENPSVFDAGAIYHTLNTLQKVNRPTGEENWSFFSNSQPIAWKTGTSFGFKDAWAVGVTPKYAIGVWVGNADGEGRPGLTGIQTAAPILFDLLNELPNNGDWFDVPYDELIEAEICVKSGHIASIHCDDIAKKWIPKNGIKTKSCPYHQKVFLDRSESYRVNSSCYPLTDMKQKNWFSLPPFQEHYFASKHPNYRPLPPFEEACLKEGEKEMEFMYPKRNEEIVLPKDFDEQINEVVFKLAHRLPETIVYWYLDSEFLGSTQTFHEISIAPKPGTYMLSAMDYNGNEIKQQIKIITTSKK